MTDKFSECEIFEQEPIKAKTKWVDRISMSDDKRTLVAPVAALPLDREKKLVIDEPPMEDVETLPVTTSSEESEPKSVDVCKRTYSCEQCGLNFASSFNLRRHVRKLHSAREVEDGDSTPPKTICSVKPVGTIQILSDDNLNIYIQFQPFESMSV